MDLTPFFGHSSRNGRVWDPFSTFHGNIFDPMDNTFDRPFGRDGAGAVSNTRVDWVETSAAHVFKADLPGLRKKDVKVEVLDGRTLSISGERNKEEVQETDSWRCVERSHGKFSRRFRLPENAKTEEVAAKVENGVLTVTVPKVTSEAPRVRAIDIAYEWAAP